MITALIGMPGSGKSYYAVKQVMANLDRYATVAVLMDGIDVPGVQRLDLDTVAPVAPGGGHRAPSSPLTWVDWRKGSVLLVIDEVQNIWGTQGGRGQYYTQECREFFTQHRHYGFDVMLISQTLEQITAQLRGLVDRTIQVRPAVKKMTGGTSLGRFITLRVYEGHDLFEAAVARRVHKVDREVFLHYRSFEPGCQESASLDGGHGGHLSLKIGLCAAAIGAALVLVPGAIFAQGGLFGDGDPAAVSGVGVPDPAIPADPPDPRTAVKGSFPVSGVSGYGAICTDRGCVRVGE